VLNKQIKHILLWDFRKGAIKMKNADPTAEHSEVTQPEASLESLEDYSMDLGNLEEKKRLSTAMSSYYLLYR
jgi:hypothetical protein